MKVAVLSDIHANLAALQAVLKDIKRHNVDGLWVLGDIIGRGCNPLEVTAEMRLQFDEQSESHQQCWLGGNHERFVLGNFDYTDIPEYGHIDAQGSATIAGDNKYAIKVALKHAELMENVDDLVQWLYKLPTYCEPFDGIHLVHAAMRFDKATGEMEKTETYGTYLMDESSIKAQFSEVQAFMPDTPRLILGGHTHVSGLWSWKDDEISSYDLEQSHHFKLDEQILYANPGSVGFPRVTDSCPSYLTLDFGSDMTSVDIVRQVVPYQPNTEKCWSTYPTVYLDEMKKCNF